MPNNFLKFPFGSYSKSFLEHVSSKFLGWCSLYHIIQYVFRSDILFCIVSFYQLLYLNNRSSFWTTTFFHTWFVVCVCPTQHSSGYRFNILMEEAIHSRLMCPGSKLFQRKSTNWSQCLANNWLTRFTWNMAKHSPTTQFSVFTSKHNKIGSSHLCSYIALLSILQYRTLFCHRKSFLPP